MKKNELNYKDLRVMCNPNFFDFETTENLEPITSGIGQERGIKALEFGLNVNVKGYNIYLEGPSGVGKTMYTKIIWIQLLKRKKFQMIGAIYIILIDQMNLLRSLFLLVKEKNLKILWILLLKI